MGRSAIWGVQWHGALGGIGYSMEWGARLYWAVDGVGRLMIWDTRWYGAVGLVGRSKITDRPTLGIRYQPIKFHVCMLMGSHFPMIPWKQNVNLLTTNKGGLHFRNKNKSQLFFI